MMRPLPVSSRALLILSALAGVLTSLVILLASQPFPHTSLHAVSQPLTSSVAYTTVSTTALAAQKPVPSDTLAEDTLAMKPDTLDERPSAATVRATVGTPPLSKLAPVGAVLAVAAAIIAASLRRMAPTSSLLTKGDWVMAGGGGPNPNDAPWEYEGPPELKLKTKFLDRKDLMKAPYYQRRLLMSSPLSREMREKYGVRTMPIRKGDEVRVRVGEFAGLEGRVNRTYHQKLLVFVDGIDVRKTDHSRKKIGLDAAKLEITDMYMDEKRKKVLLRKLAREPMSEAYRDEIVDAYPI